MAKEKYCVIAGNADRPETIQKGVIEKGSGQTRTTGELIDTMAKRGTVGVPNYTECWGVRLDKDGNIPETPLGVLDRDYRGQIKELKWNDPKGYVINCRYLRGYNSLDVQYQDLVLGATKNISEDMENSADVYYLTMQTGDNIYDPETEPYLVQMLRIHYLNESSVYANPESNTSFYFKEEKFVSDIEKEKVDFSSKFKAMKLVNEAAEDNSLRKLRMLYRIVNNLPDDQIKDENLFSNLSAAVEENYDVFLGKIDDYKKGISNLFEKAKAYNALDTTTHGQIVAGTTKREIIVKDIPAKGNNMLTWLLENFLEEKSFDTIFKLKQITDTFK